jgi:hypothetical protein
MDPVVVILDDLSYQCINRGADAMPCQLPSVNRPITNQIEESPNRQRI